MQHVNNLIIAKSGTSQRVAVLVNAHAGTVLQVGAESFRAQIEAACRKHGWTADVTITPGKELRPRLEAILKTAPDLVLVSGGDGTVSKLLPVLTMAPCRVGILPLGTLNLLGADLGLTTDVDANIAKLLDGRETSIDLGSLNGMPFHSISGVGYSAMMARERERARRLIPFSKTLSFLWAAVRTLMFARPIDVEIVVNGAHLNRQADGVLVTNNHFDGIPWRRGTLQDGLLEVHTFRAEGLFGRLKAIASVARGNWRDLSTLESMSASEVVIRRKGRRRSRVATDGEIAKFKGDLHYSILPGALKIVVAGLDKASQDKDA